MISTKTIHPQHDKPAKFYANEQKTKYLLSAHGRSWGADGVVGVLTGSGLPINGKTIFLSHVAGDKARWVMSFTLQPGDLATGPFTLSVYAVTPGSPNPTTLKTETIPGITVGRMHSEHRPSAAGLPGAHETKSFEGDYPGPGDSQCPDSFCATGTYGSPDTGIAGAFVQVGQDDTTQKYADYYFSDDSGFWYASFSGLADNVTYGIYVAGTSAPLNFYQVDSALTDPHVC